MPVAIDHESTDLVDAEAFLMKAFLNGGMAQTSHEGHFETEDEAEEGWPDEELTDEQVEAKAKLERTRDVVLEACAAEGFDVPAGSNIGKRFKTWLKGNQEEWDKYDALTNEKKVAAREDWAKELYDTYKKKRKHTTEKAQTSWTRAKWRNLDMLIQAQGGGAFPSKRVVMGAVNIARDAMAKGRKWVRINKRSKRIEFKDIEEGDDTINTERWARSEKEADKPEKEASSAAQPGQPNPAASSAAQPEAAQTPKDGPPAGQKKDKREKKDKSSGKARGKGKKGRGAKMASPQKVLNDLVAKYSISVTQARSLLEKIYHEDSPMKSWANTPKFSGKLQKALTTVEQLVEANLGLKAALTLGDMSQVNVDAKNTITDIDKLYEALETLDEARKKINSLDDDSDSD